MVWPHTPACVDIILKICQESYLLVLALAEGLCSLKMYVEMSLSSQQIMFKDIAYSGLLSSVFLCNVFKVVVWNFVKTNIKHRSDVFIVNFEHISHIILVFSFLTLSK